MSTKLSKMLANLPKNPEYYGSSNRPRASTASTAKTKQNKIEIIPPSPLSKAIENNIHSPTKPSPFLRRQSVQQPFSQMVSNKSIEDKESNIIKKITKKNQDYCSSVDLEKDLPHLISNDKLSSAIIPTKTEETKGFGSTNQNIDGAEKEIIYPPVRITEINTLEHLSLPKEKNDNKIAMSSIFREDSPTESLKKRMMNINVMTNSLKLWPKAAVHSNGGSPKDSLTFDNKKNGPNDVSPGKGLAYTPQLPSRKLSISFGKSPGINNRFSSKLGKNLMEISMSFGRRKENSNKYFFFFPISVIFYALEEISKNYNQNQNPKKNLPKNPRIKLNTF